AVRTHVFARTGRFDVRETVVDDVGCIDQTIQTVIVDRAALELAGWRVVDGAPGTGTSGNDNGFLEPGERAQLELDVRNRGTALATGVLATVTQPQVVPGVQVTDAT